MQCWTFPPVFANLDHEHSKRKTCTWHFTTVWNLRCIIWYNTADFTHYEQPSLNDITNLKTFNVIPTWTEAVRICVSELSASSLFPPSSVRSGRPSISLSSHLCISSFWRLAPSPLHGHVSAFPAARSRDRLACSWFNNCFVTLCVFVLQRSRLSDQVS